jgi:hypothetical protein
MSFFHALLAGLGVRNIVSVAEPDPIEAVYQTAFASLNLPDQVVATLDDGSTANIDVTWDEGDYDGEIPGIYTLIGTLVNLPNGITNTGGVIAFIDVTVNDYDDSGLTPTPVSYVSSGAIATGTTSLSVAYGANHAVDDIAVLQIETDSNDPDPAAFIPADWTQEEQSPRTGIIASNFTRLSLFYRRVTQTSTPNLSISDLSYNHIAACIHIFRGVYLHPDLTRIVDSSLGTSKNVNDTAVSITGVTANQDGNVIAYFAARHSDTAAAQFSSEANANLTSLTERIDGGTATGNGGGLYMCTGVLATAGATGTLTATLAIQTVLGMICVAFKGINNYSAPATQVTSLAVLGDRQISYTEGSGSRTLVLMNESGAINGSFLPVDGEEYSQGDDLGGGNICIYNGTGSIAYWTSPFAYGTTVAFRAFSYNIGGGGALFNLNTATGNPITPTIAAAENWSYNSKQIGQGIRDASVIGTAHPEEDIWGPVSKVFLGDIVETSTELLAFVAGDNNAENVGIPYHLDQPFLLIKDKADGLPINEGWSWYASSGLPVPVMPSQVPSTPGGGLNSYQIHITSVHATNDTDFVCYYVENVGSLLSNYSVGRATSADAGRTWTKDATYCIQQTTQRSYFFPKLYYDSDITKWVMIVQNAQINKVEVWVSTDGATGQAFEKKCSDLMAVNASLAQSYVEGWGGFNSFTKTGGEYVGYVNGEVAGPYEGSGETGINIYRGIYQKILRWSCSDFDTATPVVTISKEIFTVDNRDTLAVQPLSKIITHGGKNHLFLSCFQWRTEDYLPAVYQIAVDVRVLSDSAVVNTGYTELADDTVYPTDMAWFRMHDTVASDVYLDPVQPINVLTGAALTIVNTAPLQESLNRAIFSSAGYITAPSFTYDPEYFALMTFIKGTTQTAPNNVTRSICRKEGVFEFDFYESTFLQVTLYGAAGGTKIYRSNAGAQSFHNGIFNALTAETPVGFIVRKNGSDMDVTLFAGYTSDVAKTSIQNDTFAALAENSNVVTFGNKSGVENWNTFMGDTIIRWGTANANYNEMLRLM